MKAIPLQELCINKKLTASAKTALFTPLKKPKKIRVRRRIIGFEECNTPYAKIKNF
jgi:hypothetical protein